MKRPGRLRTGGTAALLAGLLALFLAQGMLADFLEVSRRGPVRAEPSSASERLVTLDPGTPLVLLDDGDQQSGYYHVRTRDGVVGWMFRTLVRRFRGGPPFSLQPLPATADLPFQEPDWPDGEEPHWLLRSNHLVYGLPRLADDSRNLHVDGRETPGISVLVREGFVLGHFDRFKVPLWVSMRWTREDFFESQAQPTFGRPFKEDEELPSYARAGNSYMGSVTGFDRGHMARHKDNAAWGEDSSDAGCLMSNIVPQEVGFNRGVWARLENLHRNAVNDPDLGVEMLWVISGPVFEEGLPLGFVANEVGVPAATYKVLAWFDGDGSFQVRGFVLRQSDRISDLPRYLVSIDAIEEATGLDFFPDLADFIEDAVEAVVPTTVFP